MGFLKLTFQLTSYTASVFVLCFCVIRLVVLDWTVTVHVCDDGLKHNWCSNRFGNYERSLWYFFIDLSENFKRNRSFVLTFLSFFLWFEKNWISSSSNERTFIDDCISQCVYLFGFNTLHNMFGVSFQNDSQIL